MKIEFASGNVCWTLFFGIVTSRLAWAFADWLISFMSDSPGYY